MATNIGKSVVIQRAGYNDLDIKGLLKPFGGIKSIMNRGDRVLLKVNLLSASAPNTAVVTHPALVRAVAEEVLDAGGVPYIADSPSREFTKGRLDKVYDRAGLKKVAAELGLELNYDTGSKTVKVPEGQRIKKMPLANFFIKADKVIALPKIKTHSLMYMTLATKIMYGVVPGLTKARYHSKYFTRKAFADMLLDVLAVAKPQLFIMDGVVGMQGDGPMSGEPVELGVIMASMDAVAMDIAVCQMLGIEPVGVPVLKRAKIRGLWPMNIKFPLLKPDDVRFYGFILPSTAGYLLTGTKPPQQWPMPTDKCTGCGDCEKICPKAAITINDNQAEVDYQDCIRCYCCHEICPENAINLEVRG